MAGLKITVDAKDVGEFLDLAPEKTSLAMFRAVKKGSEKTFTKSARIAAKDLGLKNTLIRKFMELVPPTFKTLTGKIFAETDRVPLIHFNPKQRGTGKSFPGIIASNKKRKRSGGVKYKLKGGKAFLPGGFIATMPTGSRGVFARTGRTRLHIEEKFGPSINWVLNRHKKELESFAAEATNKELDRLLNRIFGSKK